MLKIQKLVVAAVISSLLTSPQIAASQSDRNKLPEIGAAGVSVLSIEKERQIGDIMMRQVRASQSVMHDPVLVEYINHLGNSMVKYAQDVNYSFKFFLINNNQLNAFAFFGGHIGVHSGLITTADTESELASVIAHEISHVTQRHLARKMEEQSRTQSLTMAGMVSGLLLALVNPAVGMAALSTSMAASQQASINYTRGNEKEADRVGIELLANSGFDPQGAANFFSKMAEQYRYVSMPPPMLLTHPISEARITDARLRAHSLPMIKQPPSLEFELSKARITARYQNNPEYNIDQFQRKLAKKTYALKEAAQYGLALAHFENKDYQKTEEILLPLYQQDKNNLFYVDVMSDLYIQTKQFDKAITMLARLNNLMPNNQVVALNYANVLHEAGKNELAEQILLDFLLVKKNNFIAYDLLTTIYKKQKKMALMHVYQAEVIALLGGYSKAVDELQTAYTYADDKPLVKKRIRARILQFQAQEEKIKRL
ncbi:M48 family metalloprotease [Thalassotalea sp. PLHSN55]|uniref:beta-barrel assembly-enhancing protease n=1 Tax=Thalassotalea sp. PLHSN55 TaxID=3435888 RepID=UPI003F86B7BF